MNTKNTIPSPSTAHCGRRSEHRSKRPVPGLSFLALATAFVLCSSPALDAQIIGIDSVTTSPALNTLSNPVVEDADLTHVTIDGDTLAVDDTAVFTTANGNGTFWADNGTEPTDENAAISGTRITSGVVNMNNLGTGGTGNVGTFSRTIATDDWIFITELGGNDGGIQVTPTQDGSEIGDYSLTIAQTDWGSLFDEDATTTSFGGLSTLTISGVAFKLSDFSGTTGDISQANGIRIYGGDNLDPSVVGLAAIPEPSSLGLLSGLGALLMVVVRRRAARSRS